MNLLKDGIPLLADYEELIQSPLYRELQDYSLEFLNRHRDSLSLFNGKWAHDPLRNWSRSWEVPYVCSKLAPRLKATDSIIDAGSGISFFPFYLARKFGCTVHCVDYDTSLSTTLAKIAADENLPVHYHVADMRNLPFDAKTQNAIYCISVLEHTNAYAEILNDFDRVLKPGSPLIITFDICKSGVADIGISKTEKLLRNMREFGIWNDFVPIDAWKTNSSLYLSTEHARIHNPESLPWSHPRLSALKAGLKHLKFRSFIDLTCYCAHLESR